MLAFYLVLVTPQVYLTWPDVINMVLIIIPKTKKYLTYYGIFLGIILFVTLRSEFNWIK